MLKNADQVFFVVNDLPLWQHLFSDIKDDGGKIVAYPFDRQNNRLEKLLYRICNSRFAARPFQTLWSWYILKKWNVSKKQQSIVRFSQPCYSLFQRSFFSYLKKIQCCVVYSVC